MTAEAALAAALHAKGIGCPYDSRWPHQREIPHLADWHALQSQAALAALDGWTLVRTDEIGRVGATPVANIAALRAAWKEATP